MSNGVLVNFGDVFTYEEQDFVYLGESVEKKIVYAARILDDKQSFALKKFSEDAQYKHSYNPDSMLYSFVTLETQDFKDKLAWFKDTGRDGTKPTRPHCTLEANDLTKIKQEILTGPLPQELKEIVEKTT
ncbi:MAG TPA: hypothetical protein VJM32_02945 [Candidatus Saccharimonadales bacterium]|nr:hypothetical protein [Candidatus Saccharimonadales bacterium]